MNCKKNEVKYKFTKKKKKKKRIAGNTNNDDFYKKSNCLYINLKTKMANHMTYERIGMCLAIV
jgi:hypothetical protein